MGTGLNVGIMQGRLLPPVNGQLQAFPIQRWANEFYSAQELHLNNIEWIYDGQANENPIVNLDGAELINVLSEKYGIFVHSICADYFVKYPLLRASGKIMSYRLRHLRWLIGQCFIAGISRLILPFVDNSAIHTDDEMAEVIRNVGTALHHAKHCGVSIHLETNLAPEPFQRLLYGFRNNLVMVNYDTGNSAFLGYNPDEEWEAYWWRIGSIHIKDRKLNGPSVPLGEGNVDWGKQFSNLSKFRFFGDLILQVARGKDGNEIEWAKKNIEFVKRKLNA